MQNQEISATITKTSYGEAKKDVLASHFRLQQIINEPINILAKSSSCIDLILIPHPDLVMESRVYPSLHLNCDHHMAYVKVNLKMHYPPPYEREIWH